jgi:O-acetyl-ADP-ribose deacetylase (regulator of RNase III)
MIRIIEGDILESNADIIFHQVNCQGVMGSGLAKQIRDKYPNVYQDYKNYCNQHKPEELLGTICCSRYNELNCICNVFGQLNYGTNKVQTDYAAVKKALFVQRRILKDLYWQYPNCKLAFPYKMGCGLAGGDWNIVYEIIEEVFGDYSVTIYKYK